MTEQRGERESANRYTLRDDCCHIRHEQLARAGDNESTRRRGEVGGEQGGAVSRPRGESLDAEAVTPSDGANPG